jgi:septal ring factor EnvC (AmiA/AmiB activator)
VQLELGLPGHADTEEDSEMYNPTRGGSILSNKGAGMLRRIGIHLAAVTLVLAFAGSTQAQDKLKNHFSDVANKVKATADPSQKREVLNESFNDMHKALNTVQGSPLVSKSDKAGIEHFKTALQEKQDELAGLNGYERVPDAQLNDFADYVVQDMEQATETVTISLVALLLIILIAVLIV